jgi:hypothetical protein
MIPLKSKPFPMSFKLLTILLATLLLYSCNSQKKSFELTSDQFKMVIDAQGYIVELSNANNGKNHMVTDTLSPFLSIRVDSVIYYPQKASFYPEKEQIKLYYERDFSTTIGYAINPSHITFEVLAMTKNEEVDMVIWGPYQTTVNEIIGETIGIVQGRDFAIGLQALNPKTLGGYPWTDNDCMPQINIFNQDDLSDMQETPDKDYVLYRVEAAKPTEKGSSLQAYCRNRTEDRLIQNLNHDRYIAPAYDDGGIIGSKIALFGTPRAETLATIGEIETAEGLPHPELDGVWTKTAPEAASAYIIMNFSKNDIDKAIEITKKAGLKYLYHDGPFNTWGKFELNPDRFPKGIEDLKYCVDRAAAAGLKMGVHTLSNFITTNDAYVTPVPDKRLAKVGSSTLSENIDQHQKEIPIASPDFFNQFKNNHLKTVQVNDELIRYGTVSESAPWKLLDCERGAFGTRAATHQANDTISKLIDHGYKVFLSETSLSIEMANNIAEIFNETGLRQISFDGLEGNRSTGMGNYGEILFTQTWFDNINDDIKSHYIADASRTSHYFWHMYTRMNWGEPWYAGFRESQTEYRLKNQAYFKRNLMPGMLGWFRMTDETSIEDIEWMLARSAAFDAGYALVVDYASLEKNQHADHILQLIGEWEAARISGSFSEEQKRMMEDVNNEYHLEKLREDSWYLMHINSVKYKHKKVVKQPGEPTSATVNFELAQDKTPFHFNLTARDGDISNITFEVDNYRKVEIPITLESGQTLKYAGGIMADIFDKNWKKVGYVPVSFHGYTMAQGEHSVNFDCAFSGKEAEAALELRLLQKTDLIQKQ